MKMKTLIILIVMSFAVTAIMTSCGGSKKVTESAVGQIMDDLPCQKDGRTDKNYFRAYASANGQNLNLARQKAMLIAKQNMAASINTTIKTVTDNYISERTFNDDSEFEAKFENLTREVVNQKLTNIEVICEKQSVTKDGKYNKFIAIQVDKEILLNGIQSSLSKNKKMQIDYDKMKYEDIFNKEMEKMSNQDGY